MKTLKLIILFLLFSSQFQLAKAQTNADNWNYTIRPGMAEWGKFTNGEQMHKALLIPENILTQISTERLVELCLDYPMFIEVLLLNDEQTGFDSLLKYFNGFQELMKRKDAARILLNKYKTIDTILLNFNANNRCHNKN